MRSAKRASKLAGSTSSTSRSITTWRSNITIKRFLRRAETLIEAEGAEAGMAAMSELCEATGREPYKGAGGWDDD